jgi:pimeloyl-ACP methyl ester carboxylesterase
MSLPEQAGRVGALVAKYAAPVAEYPGDWDTALINVYRADLAARDDQSILRGRKLLAKAQASGGAFCVISGDDDRVVPVRASRRVSDLLSAQELQVMSETGHLPMDERPAQLASLLLRFMSQKESTGSVP